ncbi:MAG: 2-oxoglutarate dehydrogenase E1 component, partial [Chitinophagia bacterium]|nr:2-oxoglutarate dehydrogenase E1 component [Chitinophagia bacterium]
GDFQEVIDDNTLTDSGAVSKVLLCSGKIYFELLEQRTAMQNTAIAILRLEQIYPLPYKQLEQLKAKYAVAEWYWVQEEPRNMGALPYLLMNFDLFNLKYISRPASASPATGFAKLHAQEQKAIIDQALS